LRLVDLIQEAQAELVKYKMRALGHRAIYRYEQCADALGRAEKELVAAEQAAVGLWNYTDTKEPEPKGGED